MNSRSYQARTILRLALAGWLSACGVLGFVVLGADDRGEKGSGRVPFQMLDSNHMTVDVKINGKGPYRLIFDVGAPVTLIGTRAAEASGLIKKGQAKGFLLPVPIEAKVDALGVGDLTAKDVPVIVMDHPVLKALGGFFSRPLDGILGFTFFARYRMTIDYQAREMSFEPVDYEIQDLMKTLPQRLAGPKDGKEIILAPGGLWGMTLAKPDKAKPVAGVTIARVAPGSPAASAGLKPGDVLTGLDGRWTTTVADAYTAASGAEPGRAVDVVVARDGKDVTLTVAPKPGF
jgi:membrane-associated protease RseP (regulator of RpoE activity)